MNALDHIAVKASNIAEQVLRLSPFELGYLAGILAESHPEKAREFIVSVKLNLEELKGHDYVKNL